MSVISGYIIAATSYRWMFIIEGRPAIAWAFIFRALVVPYAGLSALRPGQVERSLRPGPARAFLAAALSSVEKDTRPAEKAPRATRHDLYTLVPALTAVVLGSIGMVNIALALGDRWGISQIVIGTVVLAS